MLICGHLKLFQILFGEMVFGISNTKYQINTKYFYIFNFNVIIMTKHNK